MSLGTGGGSTTSDFRRILKGVPYIVHEAETDETTGRTEVRIGIRTDDFAAPGKYGVMLISLDPALIEKAAAEEISNTLLYMSEEDTMLCNSLSSLLCWRIRSLRKARHLLIIPSLITP